MKTFITSDLHLFHKGILNFDSGTKRKHFSSVEEMNETLVSNWNSVVGKDDLVYDLGDLGLCSPNKLRTVLSRLNGKHFLIPGNHDKRKDINKIADLFVGIENYKEIYYVYNGIKYHICMMHYPIASWNRKRYSSIHFFGHCHGTYKQQGKSMDVGIDTDFANLYPINIEHAIEYMNTII
jgi:calcineurin-like phosphoesterase family protein